MRLVVENLPPAGRNIAFTLAEVWAREAVSAALEGEPTALAGEIAVQRAADAVADSADRTPPRRGQVDIRIQASARADRMCDRCAEPVDLAVDVASELSYVPTPVEVEASKEEEGDPVDSADLDLGFYVGGEIDLASVLREALALALPTRIACADQAGCDARTEALLQAAAPDRSNPFSLLGGLDLSRSRSN